MGMIKIREEIHNKILCIRRIECIITKDSFSTLWDRLNDKEREELEQSIKNLEYDEVKYWVESHRHILDLGEMGVRQLRDLAIRYHIKNYSRLQKYELIQRLEEYIDGNVRCDGITNSEDAVHNVESGDQGQLPKDTT